MTEQEKEVRVDDMGLAFGKSMIVFTIIGIIMMILPAIVYFLGVRQYIPLSEVSKYWTGSAAEFWQNTKGFHVHGYGWIFNNLGYTDILSMLGVLLLMVTPLISMLAAMFKAHTKAYRVLLFLAALEFVISIFFKAG